MISAFLIVKNEAANLADCVATLSFADEIVIVDSGSEDDTIAIARAATERVFERAFTNFADQKNFALSQVRGDWAFSIDADERVPPELGDEIRRATTSPGPHRGYRVPRRDFFRGRWMRFTWPDYQVRLFRPASARFVGKVHETVEIDGTVGTLTNALDHFNAPTMGIFLQKLGRYAAPDASRRVAAGEHFPARAVLTHPVRELYRLLVRRAAWRDGYNGLLLASLLALYSGMVSFHGARAHRRLS